MRSPIKIIDRSIEKLFKKVLHKRRDHHISKAMQNFIEEYHPDPKIIDELTKKLEIEADRLYPLVDKSILRERIKRARYSFWITAIASSAVAVLIIILTSGSAVLLVSPLCAALIAWVATLATLPIGYDERIEGGMDSILASFKKIYMNNDLSDEEKLQHLQNDIGLMKETVAQLNQKITEISSQADVLKSHLEFKKDVIEEKTPERKTKRLSFWHKNDSSMLKLRSRLEAELDVDSDSLDEVHAKP